MKAYLKNEDDQQNEVNRKDADNLKNEDDPQNGDMQQCRGHFILPEKNIDDALP